MKRPAYARALSDRIAAGEFIALLVVAVGDWRAGELLVDRPGVARVVVPHDVAVSECDLSLVKGFDTLVLGGGEDEFYTACRLALAHGAASVWGGCVEGVFRLAPSRIPPHVVALESLPDADALLDALPVRREVALMRGSGVYGQPVFREARVAAYGRLFGPEVAERLRERIAA